MQRGGSGGGAKALTIQVCALIAEYWRGGRMQAGTHPLSMRCTIPGRSTGLLPAAASSWNPSASPSSSPASSASASASASAPSAPLEPTVPAAPAPAAAAAAAPEASERLRGAESNSARGGVLPAEGRRRLRIEHALLCFVARHVRFHDKHASYECGVRMLINFNARALMSYCLWQVPAWAAGLRA